MFQANVNVLVRLSAFYAGQTIMRLLGMPATNLQLLISIARITFYSVN